MIIPSLTALTRTRQCDVRDAPLSEVLPQFFHLRRLVAEYQNLRLDETVLAGDALGTGRFTTCDRVFPPDLSDPVFDVLVSTPACPVLVLGCE